MDVWLYRSRGPIPYICTVFIIVIVAGSIPSAALGTRCGLVGTVAAVPAPAAGLLGSGLLGLAGITRSKWTAIFGGANTSRGRSGFD